MAGGCARRRWIVGIISGAASARRWLPARRPFILSRRTSHLNRKCCTQSRQVARMRNSRAAFPVSSRKNLRRWYAAPVVPEARPAVTTEPRLLVIELDRPGSRRIPYPARCLTRFWVLLGCAGVVARGGVSCDASHVPLLRRHDHAAGIPPNRHRT